MKKTIASSLVIAFAALAAGQAMADQIEPTTGINLTAWEKAVQHPSGLTRDQRIAAVMAQREANKGQAIEPTTGINLTTLEKSMHSTDGKTRVQVKADLEQARRNAPARPYWENLLF